MVFTLVEKHTGLLTGEQGHFNLFAIFFDDDAIRYRITNRVVVRAEALRVRDACIVTEYEWSGACIVPEEEK